MAYPRRASQTLKPSTAAQTRGILLTAAPGDLQNTPTIRAQLDALRSDPPEWLVHEREVHRQVVAENARLKEERKA